MTKRRKKQIVSVVLALLLLALGGPLSAYLGEPVTEEPPAPSGFFNVTQSNDGDTITVDMAGREEKIRFIGVDTPETEDPRKPVQCFGRAASEFTRSLIGDNPVRLEADPLNTNRDRYNRLLRYVYLPDGTFVNAEIIKQGYGFAYLSFPFEQKEAFAQYQKDAREQNSGLWASCNPETNKYDGFDSNPE
jgi:endonuclease YncB( thermonuclease family)